MFLLTTGSILKTISGGLSTFANLSAGMAGFNITAMKTTLIVMGVVAAIIALLTLIAVLSGKTNDLERSMGSIGQGVGSVTGQVNGAMQPGNIPKYATGTRNHPGGLAIVGEEGPELVDMPSGSKVYTNGETMGMLGSGDTYNLHVDMNEVDDVYKLVKVFKEFKQTKRGGVV